MSTLETVDIPGVEILAVGGPYLGVGAAPGGDYYDLPELKRLAEAATELADEVKIPIKLGHSKEQPLLRNSGLVDAGGQPAAGWLENLRVEGTKLVGDAKRVPKQLAALVKVGAFRTRSAEQRIYTSQVTGKKHGWIIDGLALLGGKAPAVRTIADIVALYSAPDADLPELDGEPPEGVRTINYSCGSISGGDMADAPTLTLSTEQTAALGKALGLPPEDLAPEKLLAAIETATKTAIDAAVAKVKPDLEKATKDLEDATAELKTLKAAAGAGDGEGAKELAETLKKLAADAEQGVKAAESLRVLERDTLIEGRIRGGYLEPAMTEAYVKLYDQAPEATRAALMALPKRDDLFRTYGADNAGAEGEETDAEKAEKDALTRHLQAGLGTTREAVTA